MRDHGKAFDIDGLCGLTRYSIARDAFRQSARRAGAELRAIDYPAAGPDGEALTVDTAFLGSERASNLVIFVSGIHGVEAPCGSVCLVDALDNGLFGAKDRETAFLLVHCLNPWGYAWERRTNENGVDLNRNFRLSREPLKNRFYEEFKELIVPRRVTVENTVKFLANLGWYRLTRGYKKTEEALIGGQDVDPYGIYYTGRDPEPTRVILEDLLRTYERDFERIVYLDIHSGLGPRGKLQLLHEKEERTGSAAGRRVWRREAAVISRGDNVRFARKLFGARSVLAGTLEFGTYHELTVLLALRADHALHKDIGLAAGAETLAGHDSRIAQVKSRLKNAFAPRDKRDDGRLDPGWTAQVVGQFRAVVRNVGRLPA